MVSFQKKVYLRNEDNPFLMIFNFYPYYLFHTSINLLIDIIFFYLFNSNLLFKFLYILLNF